MASILIVEDDTTLRDTIALNLTTEGYQVLTAGDGESGLRQAREFTPDLIILDVMLPELDGLTVCRVLRKESQVPIILLTARGMETDKIIGLESGADDYIVKPFSLGEFMARVRAALRRVANMQPGTELRAGELRLDLIARRAFRSEQELQLAPREFELLAILMRSPGAVLTRETLLSRVWGSDYLGDSRTVDVHIRWLREKIEPDPSHPQWIQTVRGAGYRFEA